MSADDRIESAISKLGAQHTPPPGWERRVLAAVTPRRPWLLVCWIAIALGGGFAAGVAWSLSGVDATVRRAVRAEDYAARCRSVVPADARACLDKPEMCR